MFSWCVATLCFWVLAAVRSQPQINFLDKIHRGPEPSMQLLSKVHEASTGRLKRNSDHLITDCMHVTSNEGQYYHKATELDGSACGVYIFTEPDKKIELHFNYLDVPCENGGLVTFLDGWELNGEFFPSPEDHPKRMDQRFSEFCGKKKIKQVFLSTQNAALVQYRMPTSKASFSFTVKFVKNTQPCNILLQDTEEILTLRNYGKRSNCSISALFPAEIRVASLSVGVVPSGGRGIEMETGTIHRCQKRGLDDYAQIGGSSGLDSNGLLLADSICGIDSKAGMHSDLIGCGTTTLRLVSSGAFDNSITIIIRQMTEDDISGYLSVMCPLEDV